MKIFLASVAMATLIAGPVAAAQDAAQQAVPPASDVEERAIAPAVVEAEDGDMAEAAPASAAADPATFQVVRPGDGRLTCEALLAEINTLNAELSDAQNAMSQRAMEISRSQMRDMRVRQGASAAMTVGGVAAAFIPGAALAVGAAQSVAAHAQRAAAVAQQERQISRMEEMMEGMQADSERLMPLMNRTDHLTDLAMDKGC